MSRAGNAFFKDSRVIAAIFSAVLSLGSTHAQAATPPEPTAAAQSYPVRTIRVVMPFAAGGGIDLFARVLAKRLQESLGQNMIVDNRPGAGGNIGAEMLVKSAPDGYTLMVSSAAVAISATLYPKLGYDPGKDLIPVTQLLSAPLVVAVHPSLPARTIKELVALAKKTRGGLNYGSAGVGTASHLAGVMLEQSAAVPLTHVAYTGMPPATVALLSGQVELLFPGVNTVQPHLRSGKLRALAVTSKRKSTALPQLPTLDSYYPGFDIDNWYMLFAPPGTPAAIINRLHAEVVRTLQHAELVAFMENEGAAPIGSSPPEAAVFFRREIENYGRIVKASGAKAGQ